MFSPTRFIWFFFGILPLLSSSEAGFVIRPELSNHVELKQLDGEVLQIRTTGDDPFVVFTPRPEAVFQEDASVLAFEYFCPDGVDDIEVHHAPREQEPPTWSADRRADGGPMPQAETWQPFAVNMRPVSKDQWPSHNTALRIDFGRRPDIHIQVRNLKLRPPTAEELRGAEETAALLEARQERGRAIESYLMTEYLYARIDSIEVNYRHVNIRGSVDSMHSPGARIVELRPHENEWEPQAGKIIDGELSGPSFSLQLDRFHGGRDRLTSRFSIVAVDGDERRALTAARWADDVCGAGEREMPRLRPGNLKGMTAVTMEKLGRLESDLDELGITAGAKNIVLSRDLWVQRDLGIPFRHEERDYYFNREIVAEWDDAIRRMTEKGIVVSVVLLIPGDNERLVHPDYHSSGIYTMVNLTEPDPADLFRATIAFLAERYSRPGREFGWITHWIVFNEVDWGWVWTNMGEQPMSVYMDHYHRAMRLVWLETRRFNPTAEVFISLTHHWNLRHREPMRVYPSRAMLERLARYSRVSGDFRWGVAYHPYPQSLFQPRTWEDTRAINSFDTDYITPRNLEVLDLFMRQEAFLYEGLVRTVLLSEQGFHTPDYDERAMLEKAAAIAYTWKKMEPLSSIESFHYHRWIDHPHEGGLRLGLRTFVSDEHPDGRRKEPAFSVLSALETPESDSVIAPLKEVIGIRDWSEIQVAPDAIER